MGFDNSPDWTGRVVKFVSITRSLRPNPPLHRALVCSSLPAMFEGCPSILMKSWRIGAILGQLRRRFSNRHGAETSYSTSMQARRPSSAMACWWRQTPAMAWRAIERLFTCQARCGTSSACPECQARQAWSTGESTISAAVTTLLPRAGPRPLDVSMDFDDPHGMGGCATLAPDHAGMLVSAAKAARPVDLVRPRQDEWCVRRSTWLEISFIGCLPQFSAARVHHRADNLVINLCNRQRIASGARTGPRFPWGPGFHRQWPFAAIRKRVVQMPALEALPDSRTWSCKRVAGSRPRHASIVVIVWPSDPRASIKGRRRQACRRA